MKLQNKIFKSKKLKFSKLANELNKKKKKIISLGYGEPTFDTPNNIIDSTISALKKGYTKYSNFNGLYELRKSISIKLYRENKIISKPENIIVTAGSKQACAFILISILKPKDEIILCSPSYISYIPQIAIAEPKAKIRILNLDKKSFQINIKKLKSLVNTKTKAIIINSPNNPTGMMLEKKDFMNIAKIIYKKSIYLISDEIYEKLTFNNISHFSPGSIKKIKEQVITINGFSKSFAMTGWRLGYVNANKKIIERISFINQHFNTNTNTFIQKGAINAYEKRKEYFNKINLDLNKKSKLLNKVFNKNSKRLIMPKGGLFAFLDISKKNMSSDDFAYNLLRYKNVAVTPGVIFGSAWDSYIRISMAIKIKEFYKGIKLLQSFLDE